MGVADLITYSPKRSTLFEAIKAQIAPGSPSLYPLCPTRWTVKTYAVHSILSNYSVLQENLQKVNTERHDDYGRTAGGYLAQMEKFNLFMRICLGIQRISQLHPVYQHIDVLQGDWMKQVQLATILLPLRLISDSNILKS